MDICGWDIGGADTICRMGRMNKGVDGMEKFYVAFFVYMNVLFVGAR